MENLGRLSANERLVLSAMRGRPAASRADLPRTTVVGVVSRLLARGLLEERPGGPAGRRGRRAPVLAAARRGGRIGVIAMSHGRARCAVAGLDGTVVARRDGGLAEARDEGEIVDAGLALLAEALAAAGLAASDLVEVVVGVPGPFERGVGVLTGPVPEPLRGAAGSYGHLLERLRGDPSRAVSARLGVPATADNDANLGTLGEAMLGAGRGLRSFVYVKVAEGLGAGLYLNGALHRGTRGLAGELGHVQVGDDGPWCLCGGRGCLLHLVRGSALSYLASAYDRPVDFADVFGLIAAGDSGTRRVLTDAGRRLGRVLADTCTVLAPEAIVVDGVLGAATGPLLAGVREMLDRHTAPVLAGAVRLLGGELGDSAEILGAVALARNESTMS
jgi:predicted NBD/HSP70 family sugar kinase